MRKNLYKVFVLTVCLISSLNLFAQESAVTATWSIEEGAALESFADVNITFAGEGITSVNVNNRYSCYWFYEKIEDEWILTQNYCGAGYLDVAVSGTSVIISADPGCYSNDGVSPFNRKGEYRIVIPVGKVYFNGDKANANTEEYVLNFTISNGSVEAKEIEAAFIANPENNSTVNEIREIVISFTEYEGIVVNEPDMTTGANIPQVSIFDDSRGYFLPAGYMMTRAGEEANQLVLYVDPNFTGGSDVYAQNGDYRIYIPKNVVKFGNDINAAFDLYYTVDISSSLNTPMKEERIKAYGYKGDIVVNGCEQGERIAIYNIEGVLLQTISATGKTERIAMLSGGMYIVKVANNAVKVTL